MLSRTELCLILAFTGVMHVLCCSVATQKGKVMVWDQESLLFLSTMECYRMSSSGSGAEGWFAHQ